MQSHKKSKALFLQQHFTKFQSVPIKDIEQFLEDMRGNRRREIFTATYETTYDHPTTHNDTATPLFDDSAIADKHAATIRLLSAELMGMIRIEPNILFAFNSDCPANVLIFSAHKYRP